MSDLHELTARVQTLEEALEAMSDAVIKATLPPSIEGGIRTWNQLLANEHSDSDEQRDRIRAIEVQLGRYFAERFS